jgi:hypothetical protein
MGSLHLLKIPLPFEESPPNTLRRLIFFSGKESSVGRFSLFKRSTEREKEKKLNGKEERHFGFSNAP